MNGLLSQEEIKALLSEPVAPEGAGEGMYEDGCNPESLPPFIHHSFTLRPTPITKDSWGDVLRRVANMENFLAQVFPERVLPTPAPRSGEE
jgi:hypothetical protein